MQVSTHLQGPSRRRDTLTVTKSQNRSIQAQNTPQPSGCRNKSPGSVGSPGLATAFWPAPGGPDPGSVYYAYQPTTDNYWALATFTSASGAPLPSTVMFGKRGAAGSGNVAYDMAPLICGEIRWYPQEVLSAWSLPSSPPPGVTC